MVHYTVCRTKTAVTQMLQPSKVCNKKYIEGKHAVHEKKLEINRLSRTKHVLGIFGL